MDNNFEIITIKSIIKRKYKTREMNTPRKIAIVNNEKYYQGNICRRGHSGKRLTLDWQCVECRSIGRKKERKNPNKRLRERDWELKKNFGISIEKYNELLIEQNNLCKICNQPERVKSIKGKLKDLAVDHCHYTSKIRGLLCYTCNIGIGLFKHDPSILKNAALYCEGA